jgi:hypothetical protein
MSRLGTYIELKKTGITTRLANYLDVLRGTQMARSDLAHYGYEYALALLYEASMYWTQVNEDISFADQVEVREQAAKLLNLVLQGTDTEVRP